MIFVTVGTNELPFDRLVKEVDRLKAEGLIEDDVFIQIGYSNYLPRLCDYKRLIGFQDIQKMCSIAKIIVTHGAPSSIALSLHFNKTPIVVPRKRRYQEYMNEQQVLFTRMIEKKRGQIIPVYEINYLCEAIRSYDVLVQKMKCNPNAERNSTSMMAYIERLDDICQDLLTSAN